ncbi:MAG: nucleotide exchange factor GrpE [Gemmatimonadetes bacterium]|nr:nucleotide exchange factor GrpE [Gemmatimonadota bacterium]
MSEVEEGDVSPKESAQVRGAAAARGGENREAAAAEAVGEAGGEEAAAAEAVDEAGGEEAAAESELEKAQAEAAENYDRYLRAAAELDNFRKRTLKMRSETREETVRDLLLQVAPLLDNMRRALSQETEDAAAVKQGVELIVNQFQSILKGYGLEEIEARGEPFDPNLHEAMMEVADSEHPPGTVLEEMEKGYMLRDKVVLPARVVVSKAGEAQPQDGEGEED